MINFPPRMPGRPMQGMRTPSRANLQLWTSIRSSASRRVSLRGVLATSTLSLVFTISAYVPILTWLGVKTTEYLENKKHPLECMLFKILIWSRKVMMEIIIDFHFSTFAFQFWPQPVISQLYKPTLPGCKLPYRQTYNFRFLQDAIFRKVLFEVEWLWEECV